MSYPKEFARHFIGVGGIVIHENKALLVQLKYGRAQNRWLIPGGFLESGETLQEGVIREIHEETGMNVIPDGVLGVRSMVRNRDKLTDLYCVVRCKLISDPEPLIPQPDEIADVTWMNIDELYSNPDVIQYTKIIVKKALNGSAMILDSSLTESAKSRMDLLKYEQFWV